MSRRQPPRGSHSTHSRSAVALHSSPCTCSECVCGYNRYSCLHSTALSQHSMSRGSAAHHITAPHGQGRVHRRQYVHMQSAQHGRGLTGGCPLHCCPRLSTAAPCRPSPQATSTWQGKWGFHGMRCAATDEVLVGRQGCMPSCGGSCRSGHGDG
jgi:hypothetical protein